MISCPACDSEQETTSKFCSECGAALSPEFEATVTHGAATPPADTSHASSFSDSSHHGRFLPGTKVADRYRIVSLVGKGGMGEVYRADDLKLGHTVALKFLPAELAGDPQRLEYFHNEVRLTRQISHPNVCRVYDIGEVDGQHFLSMEYIDGEDLRILLRRIGRLPQDKGVQIAQQLCAGLAAAHSRGVLHRDLKPANIMLDGRGHVRITDFGLAKLAAEGAAGEIAGTPAYMAPEQLLRGETSTQSDLYSLGLMLYELFTGEAVRKSGSIPELMRAHEKSSLSQPSSLVADLDPAVERVILRCLEKEPRDRPKSAHAVAAALPGGDPLAAALAAGETPSPEMVAAAGESGGLSLKVGGGMFGALCLLLLAIPIVACWRNDFQMSRLAHKPDVFESNAREIIAEFGYSTSAVTSVHGFQPDKNRKGLEYWYRQSPEPLVPRMPLLITRPLDWRVTPGNPAPIDPGMISVRFDPSGKLLEFRAVPSPQEDTKPNRKPWKKNLARAAGFDAADLNDDAAAKPRAGVAIPVYADQVWTTEQFVVAARNGRPVYFSRPNSQAANQGGWQPGFVRLMGIVLIFFAGVLALRHLRMGRADTKAALRCSLYFFAIDLLLWAIGVSHDGSWERELDFGLNFLVRSLAYALRVWLYYVALEPLVRRYWPDMLISWSRLLSGQFRNALVGRDLLVGCLWGTAILLATVIVRFDWERYLQPDAILGGKFAWAQIFNGHQAAIMSSLAYLTWLLLVRLLFPNSWLAGAAFTILMAAAWGRSWSEPGQAALNVVYFASLAVLYIRFGLLSALSLCFTWHVLVTFPFGATADWYSHPGYFALASILLVAGYGFYTSTLAGRSQVAAE